MAFFRSKPGLLILLSAVLFAVAVMFAQFYLAWFCLLPYFAATDRQRGRAALRSGLWLESSFCAILLYWMPSLISDFTGSILLGIVVYAAAIVIAMLYFGLLAWCMAWFPRDSRSPWINALWIASVWAIGEWLLSTALPGMPWFGLFRISNTVLDNLYAIQAAALGGSYLLSFFIVFVNYLLAQYIIRRQWTMMAVPLGLVLGYMAAGYGILYRFEQQYAGTGKPVTIAILCDNTTPDTKWNNENGSFLVKRLLDLNAKAAAIKPDIALWTEAVVPWTYRADDDFIKTVLNTTAPQGITHIMGMTTPCNDKAIYNSAYCLLPDGKVSGRYDKHYPVSLAEKPWGFLALPFGGSAAARFQEMEGLSPLPLPTPYDKVGVLICNDGTVPGATLAQVRNGARFLVSLSNDAWFSHVSCLVRQHYLNTRLRAVEVRKDMAINCNMGTSGLVSASGKAQIAPVADDSFVTPVSVYSNKYLTAYASFPLLSIYVCTVLVLIFIFINVYSKKPKHTQ